MGSRYPKTIMPTPVMEWLCPKDGKVLVPSHAFPLPGWMDCIGCGGLILLPDLSDPDDLGRYYEPHKDFDPDPARERQMIASARMKRRTRAHALWSVRFPIPGEDWDT